MLEKILEFWEKLDSKKRIGLVSIVSIFFLWSFFLNPKLQELRKVKLEVNKINVRLQQERLKLVKAMKDTKELSAYKEKLRILEDELKNFSGKLITEEKLLNLTEILTFKENEIEYISFITQAMQARDLYKELPIQIDLNSTYQLLVEYLKYLESSNFIVRIDSINISKNEGTFNRINAQLQLIAYVSK